MSEENGDAAVSLFKPLLYRSQFVLGPVFNNDLQSWQRIRVDESICLTVHPGLTVHQVVHQDNSITLLGFILDPENPDAGNQEIIERMVLSIGSLSDVIECTAEFGGRWILIVKIGNDRLLLHDPVGMRQVFYTDVDQIQGLWCASQPGLIAEMLDIPLDQEAYEFIKNLQLTYNEYWVPGDASLYKEIKHLLPNHYLNLNTGQCCRYWPNRNLAMQPIDDAVDKISKTLDGLMQSAANRFELTLALSAGWDSRLVFAASKVISHRLSYYSIIKPGMTRNHPDIDIPARLLAKLGLKHDIVECDSELDADFSENFYKIAPMAHEVVLPRMQVLLKHYNLSKVAVTGGISEVARCHYRLPGDAPLSVAALPQIASMAKIGDHPFAIKLLERWFEGLDAGYNLNPLDLFMWEQDFGNWLAMIYLEFDIAWKDIFTPFNTRNLLLDMLSVEERYRRPPDYQLYRRLIIKMWPELLSEPINPHRKRKKALSGIIRNISKRMRHLI